ncbi:hypothetical protein EI42_05713 [Thermosporothrix hazakensis]|uniref:Uncharacterized protein n=1 Tax=Thermosporothrix hazakensis TaxID=644383 RepID=A0A326U5I4_THEHA|nr:hypothetical protein EI42_05713 [Thermosporothrix hazakensis]
MLESSPDLNRESGEYAGSRSERLFAEGHQFSRHLLERQARAVVEWYINLYREQRHHDRNSTADRTAF